MELSYDEVRRIHRLEKNSSKIVPVEQEFYNFLNSFISIEKKQYLESLTDLTSTKSRDFTNLKKMIEEIFSLREKKVLTKALVASKTGDINIEGLAIQEKKMFNEILSLLKKHNLVLLEIFSDSSKKHEKKKDLNNLSVQILLEVPSFVGADMKEYGPFKKGQVIELPLEIAKLLSERKLAEIKQ